MPEKRKPNAPIKVPCPDDLYYKLAKEAADRRMSHIDFAYYCLCQATKNTSLKNRPRDFKKPDV